MSTLPSIRNKCVLASISFYKPQQSKQDRSISDDVARNHRAKQGSGVFKKNLYDDLLKPIIAVEASARGYLASKAVSRVLVDGLYLLPVTALMDVSETMPKFLTERRQQVTVFAQNWSNLLDRRRDEMGDLFREEDYPPMAEVVAQFTHEFNIWPVGDLGGGLFDDLESELVEEVTARVSETTMRTAHAAATAPLARLLEAVANLTDKLERNGSRLSESTVSAVGEVVEALPELNVMGIPAVDELAQLVRQRMSVSYELVKDRDSQARINTVEGAHAVLAKAGINPESVVGASAKERKEITTNAAAAIIDSMRGFM